MLAKVSCCLFERIYEVVKLEPRPFSMLRWACKLGNMESLGIARAGQTVLARLMDSQIWHQLPGSVWGGFIKKIMASACPDTRLQLFPV